MVRKVRLDESWQSAAWMLERRNPREYGRTSRVEIVDVEKEAREEARRLGIAEDEFIALISEQAQARQRSLNPGKG